MKVLYISNFKDGTGWSSAALNNVLAMDSSDIDVVPRTVTYNNASYDVPQRFLELEKKNAAGCDVCIQHVLPTSYVYNSKVKNIGYLACETDTVRYAGWHKYANLMDEIWVPSKFCLEACKYSGINKPINIVPHSISPLEIERADGNTIRELENSFNFVFIGEFIERKNIKALIRAFHMEFHPSEPVNLYIKTSGASLEKVENYCEVIKSGLKIRKKYKKEIVVAGMLRRGDYISTLKQCHCFVMPSRGEGFCIPALEAMACGLNVLYTNGTGMDDFCYGFSIKSNKQRCFGAMESLPNIYTSNEYWKEIDVEELSFYMRKEFMLWKNKSYQTNKNKMAKNQASNFSHKILGLKIKEILNECNG